MVHRTVSPMQGISIIVVVLSLLMGKQARFCNGHRGERVFAKRNCILRTTKEWVFRLIDVSSVSMLMACAKIPVCVSRSQGCSLTLANSVLPSFFDHRGFIWLFPCSASDNLMQLSQQAEGDAMS